MHPDFGAVSPAADGGADLPRPLEDDSDDLYEHAPCGYMSTLLDGTIAKINATLLSWLGYTREELVGRLRFTDLLAVGAGHESNAGAAGHESNAGAAGHEPAAPRIPVGGLALELCAADGTRLPVFVTSTVKTNIDGQPPLIRTTVFDARDRHAYERELLIARDVADRERERLEHVVAVLAQGLVPTSLPAVPGMQASAYHHMASQDEVGGDFYDLFALGERRWGFFLGDVCGKGPDAATITSIARYTLRASTAYEPDPAAVLANLNTVLHREHGGDTLRYCTVIFGILTPRRGGFDVVVGNAGHPPALLLRADGIAEFQSSGEGPLVGVLPDAEFVATSMRLRPGDTLLLYTDGLTDARTGADGGRYGSQALQSFAAELAPVRAPDAVAAVKSLLSAFGDGLDDDAAVLALGVPPEG